MTAAEKMAARVRLVGQLNQIDNRLKVVLAQEPSTRAAAEARGLLKVRSTICDSLLQVGYQPWAAPIDDGEARVS